MKKYIILAIAALSLGITAVHADDDRAISVNQLPKPAQEFIQKFFPKQKVALAKEETDFLGKSYEVMFVDGNKVEFTRSGEWKEVKCRFSAVPDGIVPAQIVKYVGDNYPDAKILEIDRDKRDIELKLDNRVELAFDLQYNIIDIDMD